MTWTEALVLAVIQGITEFLPISSDGHLQLASLWFAQARGQKLDGAASLFFNVMLHLGTLAAILVYSRRWIVEGAHALLNGGPTASGLTRQRVIRAGLITVLATIPAAIAGLTLKHRIEAATEDIRIGAAGFLVTAAALLLTARLRGGQKPLERTTWLDALLVGIAQAFALLPGVSRSGTTIPAALARRATRDASVALSLLMAVAAISGAGVVELKDVDWNTLDPALIQKIVVATIVSALVGFVAVSALVRIVQRGWLWYFSVYLIVLAIGVFAWFPRGLAGDASGTSALDRSARSGLSRTADSPPRNPEPHRTRPLAGAEQPGGPAAPSAAHR